MKSNYNIEKAKDLKVIYEVNGDGGDCWLIFFIFSFSIFFELKSQLEH